MNFNKFLSTIIFLLVLGLSNFIRAQEKERIVVNNDLSLILPNTNLEMEDLFNSIKEINSNVIFLRSFVINKKIILFAVSRYEDSKKTKLDTVFYKSTVNVKVNNLGDITKNYKLISYNKYTKANKLLYTKVSSPMEGQCCVMFYFMKNNYDNVMYEIKLSGVLSEMEGMLISAEKIALSVEL
jgi:hypothetical protein